MNDEHYRLLFGKIRHLLNLFETKIISKKEYCKRMKALRPYIQQAVYGTNNSPSYKIPYNITNELRNKL